MTSICTVLAVADIATARKFYEELFGLEVWQDYGINVSFTCGLALQQAFGWSACRRSGLRSARTIWRYVLRNPTSTAF